MSECASLAKGPVLITQCRSGKHVIQPHELKLDLPVKLSNGAVSTTTKLWEILTAANDGDLEHVKQLVNECAELAYAQYNYAPPIHFAVREGHLELVEYLLGLGAHDPDYRFYPFQESLQTVASDRGFNEIVTLLDGYAADRSVHRFKGDNGEILYNKSDAEVEFQKTVYRGDHEKVAQILKSNPEFALDDTCFWGEGILLFAAKENDRRMIDLLMSYGARVPRILKWAQFYYFERFDCAKYMIERGMSPKTMSYQRVTLLHDMAQKGFIDKAKLLIEHGADLDPIDEAYQSTPLGLAARWGNVEMVKLLLDEGADPHKAGAEWSTPLAWARSKGHKEIEEILSTE